MVSIVTVHGGFGGGWEWRGVANELIALGHEVFRPTLTGMGERHHLGEAGLGTHVDDVVAVLEFEDLQNVLLTGHSSGGIVATGVADRVPDRVGLLVYVDSEVPENGESIVDLVPGIRDIVMASANERGAGWIEVMDEILPLPGQIDEEVRRHYIERLRPQPVASFTERLRLTGRVDEVRRAFVRCTGSTLDLGGEDPVERHAARARAEGWPYRELATPHDAQLYAPADLARVLDDLAGEM
jgi:pimeloyl-ACP methyl ester carboxylesterase